LGREANSERSQREAAERVERAPYLAADEQSLRPRDCERVSREPHECHRREDEPEPEELAESRPELRQQAGEEHSHLRVRQVAEQPLTELRGRAPRSFL